MYCIRTQRWVSIRSDLSWIVLSMCLSGGSSRKESKGRKVLSSSWSNGPSFCRISPLQRDHNGAVGTGVAKIASSPSKFLECLPGLLSAKNSRLNFHYRPAIPVWWDILSTDFTWKFPFFAAPSTRLLAVTSKWRWRSGHQYAHVTSSKPSWLKNGIFLMWVSFRGIG